MTGHQPYFCPTSNDVECCSEHSGFDVCCARPELHLPVVGDPFGGYVVIRQVGRWRYRLSLHSGGPSSWIGLEGPTVFGLSWARRRARRDLRRFAPAPVVAIEGGAAAEVSA